jgi:hypothetical protein
MPRPGRKRLNSSLKKKRPAKTPFQIVAAVIANPKGEAIQEKHM